MGQSHPMEGSHSDPFGKGSVTLPSVFYLDWGCWEMGPAPAGLASGGRSQWKALAGSEDQGHGAPQAGDWGLGAGG